MEHGRLLLRGRPVARQAYLEKMLSVWQLLNGQHY
jgi:hypothetical protein